MNDDFLTDDGNTPYGIADIWANFKRSPGATSGCFALSLLFWTLAPIILASFYR